MGDMMNAEMLEQTWDALCKRIERYEDVDTSQFRAFFARVHPMVMSNDFFMLTADNDFIKSWVEHHYLHVITRGLEDIFGNPFTVLIEVDQKEDEAAPQVKGNHGRENPNASREGTARPKHSATPDGSHGVREREIDNYVSPVRKGVGVMPESSFENYVLGDSNRLAYSMAVSVAENPGKAQLNPLFIYGKSGLGKTHLLLAIQNYIAETQPQLETIYVDSAEFVDDYVSASSSHEKKSSSYQEFKRKYEDVDVLLIDDVQFFTGKTGTLDIVFQILNKRKAQGKQMVFSADRAPKNIDIDERYRTRFMSGGTVDIQPPEIETKLGIIKCLIEDHRVNEAAPDFDIPRDVQLYVAEISSSNIRELKAAITKIIYHANGMDGNIRLEEVRKLLENHFSGGALKRLTIEDVQKAVESFYKVSHADLVGKSRTRDITYARYVAIYLCKLMLEKTQNEIGKKFNRDHATIIYANQVMEEKIKQNREVREEIENIIKMIKDE